MVELHTYRNAIFVCIGGAIVLNILYLMVMSYFPEFLAKLAVIIINVAFIASIGF